MLQNIRDNTVAFIRNLSIKRRLTFINMSTTGIVLLLAVFSLFANYYFSLRHSLIEELTLHAKMIGQNCTAALSFSDQAAAKEMLNALKADRNIVYAAVHTSDGGLFAESPHNNSRGKGCYLPHIPLKEGYHNERNHLCVSQSIVLDDEIIGTIYIATDLNKLYIPLAWYAGITGAIIAASLVLAFLLISNLQKTITRPVLLLRHAANRIAHGDFTTRAEITSKDEIGDLALSFNKMTEHLQRTVVSKNYVDNIIKNMAESLIVTMPDGVINTVNQITCELLGYNKEEFIGRPISMILKDDHHAGGTLPNRLIEQSTTVRHTETTYRSKTGQQIPVLFSSAMMQGENGENQGFVLVALDITMRKIMEEELRNTIEQRNRTIKEMKHLMYFSSLMNDEVHEESLFNNLGRALKEYFCPDILAIMTIDAERNILDIPIIDPPMPKDELIKTDIFLNPSGCSVLRTGNELIVNDMSTEPACDCLISKYKEGGCVCVPLTMGETAIGMALMIKKEKGFWDDRDIRKLLMVYAGLASSALYRVRLMEFTKHAAITDVLTGAYNRRFFEDMCLKNNLRWQRGAMNP